MLPTVSVIMPAYNVDQFVADAAYSALHQTYERVELIIANDGSTDRTADVAEDVRRSDPRRVRTVTIPNGGPSAARNAAVQIASGEFLALLDADDIWEREFLERQMAVFASRPEIDLVTGNGRYLGSRRHGRTVRPSPDSRPVPDLAAIISDEEAVFVMTVFRRRVLDTIGGFDETLRGNEDYDFWLRAALAGFRFFRNDEPLAWYRRRDDSLSADSVRMLEGVLRVARKMQVLCAERPERDLVENKIAYFEAELDAARVRDALQRGDAAGAAKSLAALQTRRPSLRTGVAAALARHAGPLLTTLYHLKRGLRTWRWQTS